MNNENRNKTDNKLLEDENDEFNLFKNNSCYNKDENEKLNKNFSKIDILKKDNFQNITPWEAHVNTEDKTVSIDYTKIISQFGCKKFNESLIKILEEKSGKPAHFYFKRNIVFAHRDFDILLEKMKNGNFYLYTGRGPSSKSMHLGHVIPFKLCKYFQDVFNVPLVIQITDDEKYLFKQIKIEDSINFGKQNIKDIIAFGFNPDLTYIFSNVEKSYLFEKTSLKISKSISLREACKVFGFNLDSNIGMVNFPSKEIAPCFSSSFSFLRKNQFCLIPCAVDQDPYFRLARDKAHILKEPKPVTIYVSLLPDLKGVNRKMSASDNNAIYLNDTPKQIASKINKFAFSGGKETLEQHKLFGGDTEIDVSYQYLKYFYDDCEDLERIKHAYTKGEMSTGEIKQKCIEVIQKFIKEYQDRRSLIKEDDVNLFMCEPNLKQ